MPAVRPAPAEQPPTIPSGPALYRRRGDIWALVAGGGLWLSGGITRISGTSITNNNAGSGGGGIHCSGSALLASLSGFVDGNQPAELGGFCGGQCLPFEQQACVTGQLGLKRHLTAAEIVDQVWTARFALGRTVDNVISQYFKSVRPMHLEFVEPSRRYADLIIPEGYNPAAVATVVELIRSRLG